MLERMNGTVMKTLAIIGTAGIAYLMLLALGWLADRSLGVTFDTTTETITSILVIIVGGSAGARYVTSHDVQKKEKDQ